MSAGARTTRLYCTTGSSRRRGACTRPLGLFDPPLSPYAWLVLGSRAPTRSERGHDPCCLRVLRTFDPPPEDSRLAIPVLKRSTRYRGPRPHAALDECVLKGTADVRTSNVSLADTVRTCLMTWTRHPLSRSPVRLFSSLGTHAGPYRSSATSAIGLGYFQSDAILLDIQSHVSLASAGS